MLNESPKVQIFNPEIGSGVMRRKTGKGANKFN